MFCFYCDHSDKRLSYSKLVFGLKQNALWHNLGLCEMCFADQRAQLYTEKNTMCPSTTTLCTKICLAYLYSALTTRFLFMLQKYQTLCS